MLGCSRCIICRALILIVLTAVGCSTRENPAATATSEPSSARVSDDSTAGWKLDLRVAPERPRMVRPAVFSLHLTDQLGTSVESATVIGSLNMVLMDMGRTELKFEPKGHGNYEAAIPSFDMSGPWELTIDPAQGSAKASKHFQFTVLD